MSTPRKKWPHEAEWARVDAIQCAEQSWLILENLLDTLDSADQVRQVGRAMSMMQEIKFKLTACKEERHDE